MNAKGLKEVLFEGVNKDDKDFSALVSKVKAANADLVYWGGLHDTGGLILRQLRAQGVKATFMGADGITDDEFAAIAGPGAEGTLMTYGPDPRKRPEAKDAVAKFRAKNFEPQAYTLYSYAAIEIMKQAAEAAKSLDPKKVAEVMYSGRKFKTVIGAGSCGHLASDTNANFFSLACSGLYFGGAGVAVPLPAAVPDNFFNVIHACCDGSTLTLTGTSSAEAGGNLCSGGSNHHNPCISNFDCPGGTCKFLHCTTAGCLFGPPLPIPNSAHMQAPSSTCGILTITATATGTADCSRPSMSRTVTVGNVLP